MLLKRDGGSVNRKKRYRIYKEEGLTVRKRSSRALLRNTLPGNGRQKARLGHQSSDGDPPEPEPAVEPGLRL